MTDAPLGKSRSTETKYARIPLWLFETGVSLQALATYAWLHGKYGHFDLVIPSYRTLAKQLKVSRSSVIAYVNELRNVGAIVAIERYSNGERTTNEYVIAFNEPFTVVSIPTTSDQGGPDEGGQDIDQGGQPADPGGQNADPGWSAGCTAEEDVVEEDVVKKTPNNPALPGMPPDPVEPPKPGSDDDPQWVKFWAAYPNKVSKKRARASFAQALKKVTFDDLMVGLHRYLTEDYRPLGGYVKDPAAWLNGECWADEPQPPRGAPKAAGGPSAAVPTHDDWNTGKAQVQL
ncbi:helix-turn-helix domain-containing protein [Nocardiopsis sp. FR26]|uniref:helix-turn-helix domain-containing protein n=1 Tax=Nocardiopsis sp. FR26 TaxID=2605987 RepID=UPI001356F924|nr:helix-turn-helix domain-containing protein [Nocardiopsis sp. FR26]